MCIRSLQLFEDLRFELLHFHYLLCRATFLRIVRTIGLINWFKFCIDQVYAFELKNSLLYEEKWAELVSNRLILPLVTRLFSIFTLSGWNTHYVARSVFELIENVLLHVFAMCVLLFLLMGEC